MSTLESKIDLEGLSSYQGKLRLYRLCVILVIDVPFIATDIHRRLCCLKVPYELFWRSTVISLVTAFFEIDINFSAIRCLYQHGPL